MRDAVLIGAAGLLTLGAWLMYRQAQTEADQVQVQEAAGGDWLTAAEETLTGATQGAAELIDNITGNTMKLSNMSRVTAQDLQHPNVQAMLRVIRRGEGTAGENGYRTLFGGGLFESFADHPRQRITRKMGAKNITSTAAGAYQFLSSTWDETARIMGLANFATSAQDLGAVGRIAARGALDDVKAGRFETAIKKIATEWASMPGSPYGQPVITMAAARNTYTASGGNLA